MNLISIAIKNLKKNFSFYSLYLFSVSFVLMIFFCFVSFSKNTIIMERISSDGRVETMCRAVSVFIIAFVIFYMSYSNKFFMKRRMKELGVYSLLGYRKSTMLRLLTIENIFVCLGGLVIGIITGSILHKGVTTGITILLHLTIDLKEIPFININAVYFSFIFVIGVLAALFFSNARLLIKSNLLDLVRLEKKKEKPIKAKGFVGVLGVIFLICGYALALDIRRGKASLWNVMGFSPIALLTMLSVVMGTTFFIYSFLPFACQQMKKNKKKLYSKNTIIILPKFMQRIRSNGKSLILLILLTAGTLAILGSTILSVWYPIAALERVIPSDIEFHVENEFQANKALQIMDKTVGNLKYKSYKTHILKTTATGKKLPYEYNMGTGKGRKPGFECISEKDYLALMDIQDKHIKFGDLSDSQCILVKYRPDNDNIDIGSTYTLSIGKGERRDVTVKQTTLQNPIGFSNSVGTLIISDNLYKLMRQNGIDETTVMSISGDGIRTNKMVYENLYDVLSDNPYFASAYQRKQEYVYANSSTLLLICFATIIFLIATGSILYFQNISGIIYDKDDYEILKKMGYSHNKIKKIIRRQTQIYFLIPYIMGLCHSIFALLCYKSALMDDILGRGSTFFIPIAISIVLFSIIYGIYYEITKFSCYNITLK